ncbi:hypothetical protein BCR39DRAFT_462572 [Naematelia encephala]|uniref:F-box domain-containing protein n=1 Tax=Naematelia encephala TaxID=71784 RepID=A0A1Y2BIS9_9TREE|nr:hypothetical protein BCR39DRAFT_462572 [Naematelia encephala]
MPNRLPPFTYEVPPPDGRCFLLDLPETVIVRIFENLDRVSLTRSYRLCKSLNELLTGSTDLSLQHTLQTSSLILNPLSRLPDPSNPKHNPTTKYELLSTLRERLTRFRNLAPKRMEKFDVNEPEGNLYEYLEGVLMRSVGGGRRGGRIGFWDLRRVGEDSEWEDVHGGINEVDGGGEGEEVGEGGLGEGGVGVGDGVGDLGLGEGQQEIEDRVKRVKSFGFDVAEFAVDPGQDLLVLVEVRASASRQFKMYIHLLTLSTFLPHPEARKPVIEWPSALNRRIIKLGFQICDDGLFILYHNVRGGAHDQLCGWQWTTGRHGVTIRAFPTMSFESFVLLSPSAFVIATIVTHLDPQSEVIEELNNADDLSFTHHLHLYAFPPLGSIPVSDNPSEPFPPPHTAVHVATLDLPKFYVNISEQIPPPRLLIRTDPPPRHTLPQHPRDNLPAFHPTPQSGVMMVEFFCQMPDTERDPHYIMAVLKSTLIQYLPAPTSPLLFQAFPRPAPVVPWPVLAPFVRLLGPDMEPSHWVCYVYQYRYATIRRQTEGGAAKLRVYDFDPLRVRKEISDRRNAPPPPHDGDRDGIHLVTAETDLRAVRPLCDRIKTGGKMPYMFVEKTTTADVVLVDGERIIGVEVSLSLK